MADLEEAIRLGREAVKCTACDHPNRAVYLNNLGLRHGDRLKRMGDANGDFKASIHLFSDALRLSNASPLYRIQAGQNAFNYYAYANNWESARIVSNTVINLLPRLSLRWLSRSDQQHLIKNITNFSSRAASAVLQTGGTAAEAIEILEAGRGIIAGFIFDSQSDIPRLKESQPELYFEYMRHRQEVNLPFSTITKPDPRPLRGLVSAPHASASGLQSSMVVPILQRHQHVEELDDVEAKIRKAPGFERFLLPPTTTELMDLATHGPIVSFNVTEYRSDVLLVTAYNIVGLHLKKLRLDDLVRYTSKLVGENKLSVGKPSTKTRRQGELQHILKWLWDVAVNPVLHQLGFISPLPPDSLPHIWWVTSGYMGLMPLHAAGNGKELTSDYVVSSFIPTLKAIKYSREKQLRRPLEPNPNMLVVEMPNTVGMRFLKTEEELKSIKKSICPAVLINPSKACVLNEIRMRHIVHFSCHGNSESTDPSAGGLFLGPAENGMAEHLTVRELADTRLEEPQIAFLSACSTAENSSEELIDEVIHVASAFQQIGFPHVVGTLWEASDNAAIQVAGAFYEVLIRILKEDSLRAQHHVVADALHEAVKRLRYTKRRDPISWVPFIHIGA
ncbi:hypothetical protein IFM51744_08937 [Aspergillus udagawae]|nr:hypothetical protein IFM51744_08937 [Aspergillus udagawae]